MVHGASLILPNTHTHTPSDELLLHDVHLRQLILYGVVLIVLFEELDAYAVDDDHLAGDGDERDVQRRIPAAP